MIWLHASLQTEEVDLAYEEMFEDDVECLAWENRLDIEEVVV